MRITKIKLAGFKSFVDPTTLYLPGNLTGVVGPNGCGKSNIIDAMMWVMGESSAKHLRGESMADVIFSGSSSRKPVGQATVELVFDNSDGAIGGAYAGFAEISIKRAVTRDALSNYFLNGTRCRRKDIIDVFLGTGLGARGGYSVIEQGMISRVIEAKPDELRGFLEEAAGISKYKERRRETETRIRHTNENLDRVNDVRQELDKQLSHLQRQAKAAEKYQELKSDERRLEAELLGIRWRSLNAAQVLQQQLIGTHENAVEAATATLRRVEAVQAELKVTHGRANEELNQQQAQFYAKSAEISGLEQTLQHNEDRRQTVEQESARTQSSFEDTSRLVDDDTTKLGAIEIELAALSPLDAERGGAEIEAAEALKQAEQQSEIWQAQWDDFNRQQAEAARLEHAEQVRLELLQTGLSDGERHAAELHAERARLDVAPLDSQIAALAAELESREREHDALVARQHDIRGQLQMARQSIQVRTAALHRERSELQQLVGQEASLKALQDAALGRDREQLNAWLQANGLSDVNVLARTLEIDSGWEAAVELALRLPLATLCADGLVTRLVSAAGRARPAFKLGGVESLGPPAAPSTLEFPRLSDKVRGAWSSASLLAGVYAVPDLATAERIRSRLAVHESAITPDGVWVGPNWVQVPGQESVETGILLRQRSLEALTARIERLREQLDRDQVALDTQARDLVELELGERELTTAIHTALKASAESTSALTVRHNERAQVTTRIQAITAQIAQFGQQTAQGESTVSGLRASVQQHRATLAELTIVGNELSARRRELQTRLDTVRGAWRVAREARHEVSLKLEGLRSTGASLTLALGRNQRLRQELATRCQELQTAASNAAEPQSTLRSKLDRALSERLVLETALKDSRTALDAGETALREADERHIQLAREVAERQRELEAARLEDRALQVRSQELEDRLQQQSHVLAAVIESLATEATEAGWRERLETLATKILRLGPINLAAIDEFAQLSERKIYLDNQCNDLTQALATLQDAMHKIDKETRTRFKETFDKVNTGLQRTFPILFGGGHAYLELVGEDLLETGVTVLARPPGKRNSTIHLLSGGEKALTALAFVFSLFELNPAPFCLLDEVDAPLDDTNVARLTDMLKTMAERVQFLFVTHNKITMEIAEQLIGVTMQEAGVSRLVSVNMEEAVALAATA